VPGRRVRRAGGLSFIDPGCPWQNPYVESFHGRLRDECLNLHHFAMLLEAKVVIDDWRAEYNTVRPHSALGYQPPARYAAHCTHQHQQQQPELSKPLHK
jgi:putative transposase